MAPQSKITSGGNWKKLHKSLLRDDTRTSSRLRKLHHREEGEKNGESSRKSTGPSGVPRRSDGKKIEEEESPSSTLPWFADELNEKDLAILKGNAIETGGKMLRDAQKNSVSSLPQSSLSEGAANLMEAKGELGKYVAIDCEMVGVGPNGTESALARVSIVNWHGVEILDTFVKAQEKVTDYRTWVSGVRARDVKDAPSFAEVQKKVADIIKDRILVGHAVHNDLKALLLSHPRHLTRDTATYIGARSLANTKFPSLRRLVQLRLGIEIQKKGAAHSSVEDARATMAVYRSFHEQWQQELRAGTPGQKKKKVKSTSASTSKQQIIGQGWKGSGRSQTGPKQADKGNVLHKNTDRSRRLHDGNDWWQTL